MNPGSAFEKGGGGGVAPAAQSLGPPRLFDILKSSAVKSRSSFKPFGRLYLRPAKLMLAKIAPLPPLDPDPTERTLPPKMPAPSLAPLWPQAPAEGATRTHPPQRAQQTAAFGFWRGRPPPVGTKKSVFFG